MQHSNLISIMRVAVKKVSPRVLRDFYELRFLQNSHRPLKSFVQAGVARTEEALIASLEKARPEFGIISATQGKIKSPDLAFMKEHGLPQVNRYWVINTTDGLENFMRAIPYFAISIAVKQVNSKTDEEITAGVIDAPALGELYLGEKSNGAWCEFVGENKVALSETRLRIAEKPSSCPLTFVYGTNVPVKNASFRKIGSSAISLAYLAAGRCDQCIIAHKEADSAGIIIAKEAGAAFKEEETSGNKILVFSSSF